MAVFSRDQTLKLQAHLRQAVIDCNDRGLHRASKWAAELLNSFPESDDDDEDVGSPMEDIMTHMKESAAAEAWDSSLEEVEAHKYLLAKSYFDCREFDRCASVFVSFITPKIPCTEPPPDRAARPQSRSGKGKASAQTSTARALPRRKEISRKSLFLALYAKYLAGEKRKDEQTEMILGPADGGRTKNKELDEVSCILDRWFADHPGQDGGGWLEYLYGVVLAKGKNDSLAKSYFVQSVCVNPYNWSAWEELVELFGTHEDLTDILGELPQDLMTLIFNVYASQELFTVSGNVLTQLEQLEQLLTILPRSDFLKTQQALLQYHMKDFGASGKTFSEIVRRNPYRLDSLDVFSNVLYVLGDRPVLSFLAQQATLTDKFRPETCCIVGNYYSLLSEHEKATMYFRRALSLDRSFSAAWTLMGHEYVEMKNTHAAIESYRRAIESCRRDYRAWYGLGQTYEFLEMQVYALFYFQRAASLRPFDPRMWSAIGACYARAGKLKYAIQAYRRALVAGTYYDNNGVGGGGTGGTGAFGVAGSATGDDGDGDGVAGLGTGLLDPEVLYHIAILYERSFDDDEAAAYMELVLAQEDGPVGNGGGGGGGGDDGSHKTIAGTEAKPTSTTDFQDRSPSESSSTTAAAAGNGAVITGGVGVTPTTSRARMWLAKWEFSRRNYDRALKLANELCQDGVDVDDAKALVRDIQSRIERMASSVATIEPVPKFRLRRDRDGRPGGGGAGGGSSAPRGSGGRGGGGVIPTIR